MTEADRALVGSLAAGGSVVGTLGSAALEGAVFDADNLAHRGRDLLAGPGVSPFLTFAVAVHRTAGALDSATFVTERIGSGMQIPLFDVRSLVTLLADPLRRYFFIELLASYTRVSSGATWRRTARGWRRQRFSELDPSRLAELLDVVTPEERPGVYRRLGDLSLFLLGVFPDHPPLPVGAGADRLVRHSGIAAGEAADLSGPALFERLGASWYRAATRLAKANGQPATGTLAVAGQIADRFSDARRVLNAITDRYLFPLRSRWFPA